MEFDGVENAGQEIGSPTEKIFQDSCIQVRRRRAQCIF